MDQQKFEGIIEAIIAESKQPAPSHANLARLVAMAFRELLVMQAIIASGDSETVGTTTNGATEVIYGD